MNREGLQLTRRGFRKAEILSDKAGIFDRTSSSHVLRVTMPRRR